MDLENPDFRVTLRRDGVLRLVDFADWLVTAGPLNVLVDARGRAGVCIADLSVLRDGDGHAEEVLVDVRCGDVTLHRETLVRWASAVGYQRIWLQDELIELDPCPSGRAETRCTGCRVRLVDFDAGFWAYVRERGAFPTTCCLCGSDLPQWWKAGRRSPARSPARERALHR